MNPAVPACYDVEVLHRRREPVAHEVRHAMTTWLVDADHPPRLPGMLHRLCRFDPRDHLDLRAFLAERGLRPHRVLMLAQPRVYGYVFNPLTVFYCLNAEGDLTHLVAEVRNTYGGRHAYLLPIGDLHAQKAFHVSPFEPVQGEYTLRLPLPADTLTVSVTLRSPGRAPFLAAMTGVRRPGARLQDALRRPLETRAVMAGIRRHGLALYGKGLRPYPRPADDRRRWLSRRPCEACRNQAGRPTLGRCRRWLSRRACEACRNQASTGPTSIAVTTSTGSTTTSGRLS